MRKRWWWVVLALVPGGRGSAQAITEDGTVGAIWGDPSEGGRPVSLSWIFRSDSGVERELVIAPSVLESAGGFFAVNGKRVTVSLTLRLGAPSVSGGTLWEATTLRPLAPFAAPGVAAAPQLGTKPYVALLCKFSDIATEPISSATLTTTLTANSRPGIDHYWREVSAGQMNVAGTQVFGWFTLPRPRASYMNGTTPNTTLLATDCTAAADAQVDFTQFSGILQQFNGMFTSDGSSGSAYGGIRFLTLDGVSRSWPTTWMPTWAAESGRYGVYAHEMGHSLGLPHSSGPYSEVYDSDWDVMSNSYPIFTGGFWIPQHTIAAHKDALGWIPASRQRTIASGEQTLTLDQHEGPAGGSNPLLVRIPISGTSAVYMLEARRQLGYDAGLPGEAVIIHRVTGACDLIGLTCARVVDTDNNGDPNDAGAMWIAGETFDDGAGVRVRINSRTVDGWNITVTVVGVCTLTLGQSTGGTIALTSGMPSGSCGRSVTVTATPSSGYSLVSWSTGATANPLTLTLDQNTSLSATFTQIPQCPLALAQTVGGDIALTSGTLTGACGRIATVAATPGSGYAFTRWSTGSTANPLALTLSQTTSLSATFTLQCTLSLVQTTGGAVALSSGTLTGDCGRSVTATATPSTGYVFIAWSDGTPTSSRTLSVTEIAQSMGAVFTDLAGVATRASAAVLAGSSGGLTNGEVSYLDAQGNNNGRVDLGDLLALLDRNPGIALGAPGAR